MVCYMHVNVVREHHTGSPEQFLMHHISLVLGLDSDLSMVMMSGGTVCVSCICC